MNVEACVAPRIFVVDDERVIAWTLSLILKQEGFDTTAFYDPKLLLENSEKAAPDLVISDVVMPEMTGIELALRLRATHPSCKLLLFSGQAETSDLLQRASEQGHEFTVLSKPLRPAEMIEEVRKLVTV